MILRFLKEIIDLVGCLIGGMFSLLGFTLLAACVVAGLLAWACFEIASELYAAHSPKEGKS